MLSLINYENILFVFYILCRILGIFLVSPLLANKSINNLVRFYLSLFTALVLVSTMHQEYVGPHAKYIVHYPPDGPLLLITITIEAIRELIIGYIIGFLFNIIFEAMILAGDMIDTMIGLATAQFIDPISNVFQSLLGTFLMFFGMLYMLVVDFHHVFIRIISYSFAIIPLGNFDLNPEVIDNISFGTSLIFTYAIKIGAVPFVILACGLVGPAITVRVVPEMNLLLIGFPMRVLLALYMLMIAIAHIPSVFQNSFVEVTDVVEKTLYYMGNSD